MRNLIITYTIFLLTISCETVLDIEIPGSEAKLVINSYIISEETFPASNRFLHISHSTDGIGVLTDLDSLSMIGIKNATASISEIDENENTIEQFPLNFDEDCSCYIDNVNNFIPKENTFYKLDVQHVDFENINAIDKTPSKPNYTIESFELITELDSNEEGELCYLNIAIQDPPEEDNYYKLKIYVENIIEDRKQACIYEVADPAFLIPINRYSNSSSYYMGKWGYFTDNLFNGEERNFSIVVNKPDRKKYTSIRVEIVAYSKNLYEFNLTRKEQRRETGNILFNSEPVFIESNINGGYGIFGAKTSSKKIYIAGQWFDD